MFFEHDPLCFWLFFYTIDDKINHASEPHLMTNKEAASNLRTDAAHMGQVAMSLGEIMEKQKKSQ